MITDPHKASEIVVDHSILGKKLENPYSIRAMRAACEELYPATRGNTAAIDSAIAPNYLYVRMLPEDSLEFNSIMDLDYEYYSYPLDYEILGDPGDYHDPSVPPNEFTWQYTVVPINDTLPKAVRYEILDTCLIPDVESSATASESGVDLAQVENASYDLTDNGSGSGGSSGPSGSSGSTVSNIGKIMFYSDPARSSSIPVKGIKVRARRFLKIRTGYTRDDGTYTISRLSDISGTPRFELRFENKDDYKLGYGFSLIMPYTYDMKNYKTITLDRNIDADKKAWALAAINDAAYDWYKRCSNEGIAPPPGDMRVWALENFEGASTLLLHHGTLPYTTLSDAELLSLMVLARTAGPGATAITAAVYAALDLLVNLLGPDITVCNIEHLNYEDIYEFVCHEFSHSSHFRKVANSCVGAAWWADVMDYEGRCIVTSPSDDPYGSLTSSGNGKCGVTEMWATAVGDIMSYEKTNKHKPTILSTQPIDLTYYWFKGGIVWDLYCNNILSLNEIMSCMTSDINDIASLKSKLMLTFTLKSAAINSTFANYGF
jgi:hypothetical protein